MSDRQRMLVVVTVLFSLVLASAILLVYSKHQSRKLFVQLQQMEKEVDDLNTEWSRLQLEQGAWSDHGRIENVARERLSLVMPEADDVVFIQK